MARLLMKYCGYNSTPSFSEQRRNILALLVLLGLLNCSQHGAIALTQSHQGSATTVGFTLNGASPNARIQITSSSTVYVVNVEPPAKPAGKEAPEWKVSLELLALQLCEPAKKFGGDMLKVVYSDPTSIRSFTWKLNASYVQNDGENKSELRELENIQANQIVLLPEGRWVLSGADLVATLYQEPSENRTCSEDTFFCSCASKDVNRCIPKILACNKTPYCRYGCRDDESESLCSSPPSSSTLQLPLTSCTPEVSSTTTTIKPPLGSGNGVAGVTPKATFISISAISTILVVILLAN